MGVMGKKPYSGKITDILIRGSGVNPEALSAAEANATKQGERLEKYLVENGVVSADVMVLALSEYLGLAPMNVAHINPHQHLLELVPREMMKKQMLIPIADRIGNELWDEQNAHFLEKHYRDYAQRFIYSVD